MALTSLPASAQFDVRVNLPLPGLDVRIGNRAPPPLQREVRTQRPSRQHVWIPGAWDWQSNDWAWVGGRWDQPASRRAYWVKARYVRQGRAWVYEPAHWSNQRIVRGEEYQRWRQEYRRNRNYDPNHDRNRDNDRGRDNNRGQNNNGGQSPR
jgi:hypothetical protein